MMNGRAERPHEHTGDECCETRIFEKMIRGLPQEEWIERVASALVAVDAARARVVAEEVALKAQAAALEDARRRLYEWRAEAQRILCARGLQL